MFKLPRYKIQNYIKCPRCFYLDMRYGIKPPNSFPYTLNNTVDNNLKNEFDYFRKTYHKHPLFDIYNLDFLPYNNELLDDWRDYSKGISYNINNLNVMGCIDDIWIDLKTNELIIVDYKATSTERDITIYPEYKQQLEIYQWLFKKNGYKVSDTGYFVYCNAIKEPSFNCVLNFDVKLIPYKGNCDWVENVIMNISDLLSKNELPESNKLCNMCEYTNKLKNIATI